MMTAPESNLPIDQFLTYRILTLTSRLNRQAMQILEDACGLRLPEWRCMAMIGRRGQIGLFTISDIAGMDRGLVSRSIQSLVEQGLVVTERDADDRRIVRAALTEAGEAMFQKTFPVMQRRQLRLLSSLSPGDQEAFYRIMDCLAGSIDAWEVEQKSHAAV